MHLSLTNNCGNWMWMCFWTWRILHEAKKIAEACSLFPGGIDKRCAFYWLSWGITNEFFFIDGTEVLLWGGFWLCRRNIVLHKPHFFLETKTDLCSWCKNFAKECLVFSESALWSWGRSIVIDCSLFMRQKHGYIVLFVHEMETLLKSRCCS